MIVFKRKVEMIRLEDDFGIYADLPIYDKIGISNFVIYSHGDVREVKRWTETWNYNLVEYISWITYPIRDKIKKAGF